MTTKNALDNWTRKPIVCPYCKSPQVSETVTWLAQSKDDPDNSCEVTEYQCQGECEGQSFWV